MVQIPSVGFLSVSIWTKFFGLGQRYIRSNTAVTRLLVLLWIATACEGGNDTAELVEAKEDPSASAIQLQDDEVDRLRALGYVEVVENHPDDKEAGIRLLDADRSQAGLTFFTNADLCTAQLMTPQGKVLRSWSHEPCDKWGNTVLLPTGEVLAVHRDPNDGSAESARRARKLVKFGWDGEALWSRDLSVHHDIDPLADGRIAALTYRHRVIPEIDPAIPIRDDSITLLGPDGQTLEEASLTRILLASPEVLPIQEVKPQEKDGLEELDLLHSNSIEWMRDPELAGQNPLYALSNVVICFRHQDAVAIIDWEQKRVVWAWGQGELSGPHDATVLPSGNLLIFDNGLRSKRSRVVEVDPRRNEIVWSYEAPATERLFNHHRGAAQRLSNGNTLVTDSRRGRAFEVTSSGEMVWDFWNPNLNEDGKRVVIVRARRTQSQEGPHRFTVSD